MKIPGPKIAFTELIDEVTALNEAENPRKSFPLRPSAAGYCARKLAYDLMQYRGLGSYGVEVKSPATVRLLRLGSSIEYQTLKDFDALTKRYPEYQIKYKKHVVSLFRLSTGELVEGELDFTMVHPTDGNGIGDAKSKKDKFSAAYKTEWDGSIDKFNKMQTLVKFSETGWYAPDLPAFLAELNDDFFSDNFIQVNSYLCTDWAKEHDMKFGFIFRVNKNDSRQLEIRFAPSQELYDAFRDKCERVVAAVKAKKPENVKKDYLLGSMRCAFCPYSKECWGGKDALKLFFKTWPKKDWPVDTHKLKHSKKLEEAFDDYEQGLAVAADTDSTEQAILKYLVEEGVEKVRIPNGNVYEVKVLKSPRPHAELRRSKA